MPQIKPSKLQNNSCVFGKPIVDFMTFKKNSLPLFFKFLCLIFLSSFQFQLSANSIKKSHPIKHLSLDQPNSTTINCDSVEVFNVISPNNDGINDVFVIKNINNNPCYPKNFVEIYNRWGKVVYRAENYDNNSVVFEGFSNSASAFNKGERLPDGTYYYMIKLIDINNNISELSGYLQILR